MKNISEIATTTVERSSNGWTLAGVAGGALGCAVAQAAMARTAQAVPVTQAGNSSAIAAEGHDHDLDFYWCG